MHSKRETQQEGDTARETQQEGDTARETQPERDSRNDKDDEADLDPVGDPVVGVLGGGGANARDECDKEEDGDEDVGDLVPDALPDGHLLLLGELVGSELRKAGGRLGGGQARLFQVARQLELGDAFLLGAGVPRVHGALHRLGGFGGHCSVGLDGEQRGRGNRQQRADSKDDSNDGLSIYCRMKLLNL
jgi:hypothetical protein